MPQFVHPIQGFEVEVMVWDPQPTATNKVISMEGWDWFIIGSADILIDNTAGAVAANAQIFTQWGGVNLLSTLSATAAAIGGIQRTMFHLMGGLVNPPAQYNNVTLGLIVNPNASTITVGFTLGDAGTRLSKGSLLVYGTRRRTNKPKP